MRSALTAKLLTAGRGRRVIREPLVRSVHSYAFAVLRQAAARAGDPPPRLVTGAEQDGIIRELLAGDLADGPQSASGWPRTCARRSAPPGSPPNSGTCWPAAPSGEWIRCGCSASADCPGARNGLPRAASPSSTSR